MALRNSWAWVLVVMIAAALPAAAGTATTEWDLKEMFEDRAAFLLARQGIEELLEKIES